MALTNWCRIDCHSRRPEISAEQFSVGRRTAVVGSHLAIILVVSPIILFSALLH